jgi:hypothetical protein
MKWFEVDKAGLRKLMERRGGKSFAVAELLQNAWDAPGVTTVDLSISPVPGEAKAFLKIVDDSPTGCLRRAPRSRTQHCAVASTLVKSWSWHSARPPASRPRQVQLCSTIPDDMTFPAGNDLQAQSSQPPSR